ncbi:MAG: hypothetical protein WBE04_03735, partial [Methyloceanibacter sp.]
IGRLALEAFQFRDIQRRILLDKQFIAADIDAAQRRRRSLEIVAAIKRFGQHDFGIVVARPEHDGLFQPFLRVVKPVGKKRDAAQAEDRGIVLGVLASYARVDFAGFGKFPALKELIGGIDFRLLRL